jgi:hypothetical protein
VLFQIASSGHNLPVSSKRPGQANFSALYSTFYL